MKVPRRESECGQCGLNETKDEFLRMLYVYHARIGSVRGEELDRNRGNKRIQVGSDRPSQRGFDIA